MTKKELLEFIGPWPLDANVFFVNRSFQSKKNEHRIESFIVLLMDSYWEICVTCKHYMDFRWPDQIIKHGYKTGHCLYPDEKTDAHEIVYPLLVVTAESTCDKYEALFGDKWKETATKVKELMKVNRGY